MNYLIYTFFFSTLLFSDNIYCDKPSENNDINNLREYYNIGDTISQEDQLYQYNVCHSDGVINLNSEFSLSNYVGNIILISMNATW